jgi:hypothetical protein
MERILITKEVENCAADYLSALKVRTSNAFRLPKEKLEMFRDFLQGKGKRFAKYAAYVDTIIQNYDEVILLKPDDFDAYEKRHFKMLKVSQFKKKLKYQKSRKSFYEHVVDAMRYRWVREFVYLGYGLRLGIKACVYCNAQYATTASIKGKIAATYDLDHYYPKSHYPFLCTSFYNLVPVCARCNRVKNDSKPTFCLYTDDFRKLRPFKFGLDPKSVINYMLTHQEQNLTMQLVPNVMSEKKKLNEHIHQLGLDELYSAHKDVASEVLWKAKIYNKAFRQQLETQFGKLFPHMDGDVDRFITGFSLRKGDVHKRPLTLMGQDIYDKYRTD